MPVYVRIPTTLRAICDGLHEVEVEASTVREALAAVDDRHPGFSTNLIDEHGKPRLFVNIFLADEDIRFLGGLDAIVEDGHHIAVVQAVAGG